LRKVFCAVRIPIDVKENEHQRHDWQDKNRFDSHTAARLG
jgi:hypothetical protein